jgi:RecB family exonuclease
MDDALQVSHSSVRTFGMCRRSYYLRYMRALVRRPQFDNPVGVAQLGSRVHLALEGFYGHRLDPLQVVDAAYTVACARYPEHAEELIKERAWAMTMVEGYMQWAAAEGVDEDLAVLGTEQVLEHALALPDGRTVNVTGKLDMLVRNTFDGRLYVVDYKTVGALSRIDTLVMDQQMPLYALLVSFKLREHAETDEVVDGALYRMILRSKRTARAAAPFYAQEPMSINTDRLNGAYRTVREAGRQIYAMADRIGAGEDHRDVAYPTPGDHCRWACAFRSVCPLFDDGSHAEQALDEGFTAGDPWSYRSTAALDDVRALLGQPRVQECDEQKGNDAEHDTTRAQSAGSRPGQAR